MRDREGMKMLKRKITVAFLLFAVVISSGILSVCADTSSVNGHWFPKYYFRKEDGTVLKKTGLVKIGEHYYYLNKDHSRYSGFKKIKKQLCYFQKKNGRQLMKTGWITIAGKKYYFLKNHSAVVGMKTIRKKRYYFGSDGALQINNTGFEWKGHYYKTDQHGLVRKASALQVRCSQAAWRYINSHSSPGQSAMERYRSCFNFLESYLKFHPKGFGAYDFSNPEWPYAFALDVFEHDLIGDCFGFACCMAVIGKELGFHPTVIVAKEDHAFVVIDGKYIDNDGNMFFSSASHAQYTPYRTAVL